MGLIKYKNIVVNYREESI